MVFNINYPIPPEYYIAWSGTVESPIISYGFIESAQCLSTGLDNLEVFLTENEYKARLLDFGITLTSDIEGN